MTTLTADQQRALDAFTLWLEDAKSTAMLIEGGAGTGKTFLLAEALRQVKHGLRVCAAPTHKATNVLRRKLEASGVEWVRGYDHYTYDGYSVVTGTLAALLGIVPIITEDQTARDLKFERAGKGILSKAAPRLIVVDEVSMIGARDFMALCRVAKRLGAKVLAIGDSGQLPPVKAVALPFENFVHASRLTEIVRQGADSAIPRVAWAIRDRLPWRDIEGQGVRRVAGVADAFIEEVSATNAKEEDRPVFIAYRNAVVNAVQERACQKCYGHGRKDFRPGELVLAGNSLYSTGWNNKPVLLCANQDELLVEHFGAEDERDPVKGLPVILRPLRSRGCFRAYYLSGEELGGPRHPYNVELSRLSTLAQGLQAKAKEQKGRPGWAVAEENRKDAWKQFFELKDKTVISFSHPFAITSHKSQGSTYRQAFVDVADLGRFSQHALYVAVTRPSAELVVAR